MKAKNEGNPLVVGFVVCRMLYFFFVDVIFFFWLLLFEWAVGWLGCGIDKCHLLDVFLFEQHATCQIYCGCIDAEGGTCMRLWHSKLAFDLKSLKDMDLEG